MSLIIVGAGFNSLLATMHAFDLAILHYSVFFVLLCGLEKSLLFLLLERMNTSAR